MKAMQFGEREVGAHVAVGWHDGDDGMRVPEIEIEPERPGFQVVVRGAFLFDEMKHEFFPVALFALQLANQLRLLQDHFGGNPYQIAELADRFRLSGQADDAADLAANGQRQIDAGFDAGESSGGCLVDFNRLSVGEGKLGARVQLADTSRLAAGDDDAAAVHDVDVERDDLHRSLDDFLGYACLDRHHVGLARVKQWKLGECT